MSEYKIGTLRLRSVRLKSGGGEIRVMRLPSRDEEVNYAKKRIAAAVDAHSGRVAGFAAVIWGADNSSTSLITVNAGSRIPSIYVPDFVRNRLLASQIEAWTMDNFERD